MPVPPIMSALWSKFRILLNISMTASATIAFSYKELVCWYIDLSVGCGLLDCLMASFKAIP